MTGRVGVLLVQLGGPERREELRPFLYELFADPEIIGLPSPLRQVVAFLSSSSASFWPEARPPSSASG